MYIVDERFLFIVIVLCLNHCFRSRDSAEL